MGGGFRRTVGGNPFFRELIDHSEAERNFWPDDGEINIFPHSQIDKSIDIVNGDWKTGCLLGDSGISGRGNDLAAKGTLPAKGNECMFAPAGTDDQYLQWLLRLFHEKQRIQTRSARSVKGEVENRVRRNFRNSVNPVKGRLMFQLPKKRHQLVSKCCKKSKIRRMGIPFLDI